MSNMAVGCLIVLLALLFVVAVWFVLASLFGTGVPSGYLIVKVNP